MAQFPPAPAQPSVRARQRAEALAAPLPPLLVTANRIATTVAQGVHGRRRVGTGEAFWQFRRYDVGDSADMIDWRQSAKTQRVFVRENEWEAAQSVWLWRDASASMAWRSTPALATKRDRAELLLLALAVLLVRGGERIALLGAAMRPEAGRFALNRAAQLLIEPGTATAPGLPGPEALPRHARVVLFGDFLAPPDAIQAAIAPLTNRGIRGHLVHILDPAEETLPFEGRIDFDGLEGEAPLLVPRVEAVRSAYVERLAAHRAALGALVRAAGWTLTSHHTDRPPQTALLALYHALAPG